MGFHSFKTQDTNKSVISGYVVGTPRVKHTRAAYLVDDKGNTWGSNYDGYGKFGKDEKDFYELVAEMNGKRKEDLKDGEELRDLGHRLMNGVNIIKNIKTKKVYQASIDFGHWGDDILEDGMSANQLVESGEWERSKIKEKNILYPNIVENLDGWEYKNKCPKNCPYQGYFL